MKCLILFHLILWFCSSLYAEVSSTAIGRGKVLKVLPKYYEVENILSKNRVKVPRKKNKQYNIGDTLQWGEKINSNHFNQFILDPRYQYLKLMMTRLMYGDRIAPPKPSKKTSFFPQLLNFLWIPEAVCNSPGNYLEFSCTTLESFYRQCQSKMGNARAEIDDQLIARCKRLETRANSGKYIMVGQRPAIFVQTGGENEGYGSMKSDNLRSSSTSYYGKDLEVDPSPIYRNTTLSMTCNPDLTIGPGVTLAQETITKPTGIEIKSNESGEIYLQFPDLNTYNQYRSQGAENFTEYCGEYVLENKQVDNVVSNLINKYDGKIEEAILYTQSLLALLNKSQKTGKDSVEFAKLGDEIYQKLQTGLNTLIEQQCKEEKEICLFLETSGNPGHIHKFSSNGRVCFKGAYLSCSKDNMVTREGYVELDEPILSANQVNSEIEVDPQTVFFKNRDEIPSCNQEQCYFRKIPESTGNTQVIYNHPSEENPCLKAGYVECKANGQVKRSGYLVLDQNRQGTAAIGAEITLNNSDQLVQKTQLACPSTRDQQIANSTKLLCSSEGVRYKKNLFCKVENPQDLAGLCVFQVNCQTVDINQTTITETTFQTLTHTVTCEADECQKVLEATNESDFNDAIIECGDGKYHIFTRSQADPSFPLNMTPAAEQ